MKNIGGLILRGWDSNCPSLTFESRYSDHAFTAATVGLQEKIVLTVIFLIPVPGVTGTYFPPFTTGRKNKLNVLYTKI